MYDKIGLFLMIYVFGSLVMLSICQVMKFLPKFPSDGAWSPTRSAVLFLGGNNGTLRIYDLLTKQKDPVILYT